MGEIEIQPGETEKLVSSPGFDEQYKVQVSGAPVYVNHRSHNLIEEGDRLRPGDRLRVGDFRGKALYGRVPRDASDPAVVGINKSGFSINFFSSTTQPTTVETTPAEGLAVERVELTSTVFAGSSEVTTIQPPAGEVWEIQNLGITIPATGGGAGNHTLRVSPENQAGLEVLTAETDGTNDILYSNGQFTSALSAREVPSDPTVQFAIVRGLRLDSDDGIRFGYDNITGSDQTNTRIFTVYARKLKVDSV